MSLHRLTWTTMVSERYALILNDAIPEHAKLIEAIRTEDFEVDDLAGYEEPTQLTGSDVEEREFEAMTDQQGVIEA